MRFSARRFRHFLLGVVLRSCKVKCAQKKKGQFDLSSVSGARHAFRICMLAALRVEISRTNRVFLLKSYFGYDMQRHEADSQNLR